GDVEGESTVVHEHREPSIPAKEQIHSADVVGGQGDIAVARRPNRIIETSEYLGGRRDCTTTRSRHDSDDAAHDYRLPRSAKPLGHCVCEV
ncbi:MAG: hypothetical protein RLZZ270_330, partial [Actinomycetota bacterium]